MGFLLFTVLSVILLASALLVILQNNPLYCALSLVVTLSVLAIFFLFLSAELVAVLQILVYAGAIMVLFLFVIMLLNLAQVPEPLRLNRVWAGAAVGGAAILVYQLFSFFQRTRFDAEGAALATSFGTVREVARSLFSDFLLPFEITSVLLLVALIGAVVLTRQEEGL
jgi:NADH-quinone oxidoreductase subunit J